MTQIVIETPMEQNALVGRSTVRGKFLYVGTEKFWVRGISYGTFYVDDNGEERRTEEMVRRDFAQIAASRFNVVRIHTGPPRWFLDLALEHGLRVMVGLNWGEHMAFLDEPGKVREIEDRVRRWIRTCRAPPSPSARRRASRPCERTWSKTWPLRWRRAIDRRRPRSTRCPGRSPKPRALRTSGGRRFPSSSPPSTARRRSATRWPAWSTSTIRTSRRSPSTTRPRMPLRRSPRNTASASSRDAN